MRLLCLLRSLQIGDIQASYASTDPAKRTHGGQNRIQVLERFPQLEPVQELTVDGSHFYSAGPWLQRASLIAQECSLGIYPSARVEGISLLRCTVGDLAPRPRQTPLPFP